MGRPIGRIDALNKYGITKKEYGHILSQYPEAITCARFEELCNKLNVDIGDK